MSAAELALIEQAENIRLLADGIREIKVGQLRAADQLAIVGREQKEAIAAEGARQTSAVLVQANGLILLNQQFVKLQNTVTTWAAAGALLGAVILFIAVRGLGF